MPEVKATVITPASNSLDIRELWQYRGLLRMFVWRDVKLRYKQTVLGLSWAIAQPLFTMIVFSLLFGALAKIPSEGIPYPLFSYSGLLAWTLFSGGLGRGASSLVTETSLVQKVYFPRIVLPLSGVLSPLLDFAIAFVILIGLMIYFGYYPSAMMLFIIPLLALQLLFTLGLSFWLSAINVEYRDIAQVIPFLIQLLLFASPVIYATSLVPARFHTAYMVLNPMAGIIEGYRWAILGTERPDYLLGVSILTILAILVSGAIYFKHREKAFADVI